MQKMTVCNDALPATPTPDSLATGKANFETLGDLKAFLNSLPEEQLAQKPRLWDEGFSGTINGGCVLEEDYINPSGEGCEPISAYKDEPDYADYASEVVYPGGTVMFEAAINRE